VPLGQTRQGKRRDETAEVVRQFERALDRILGFLGYTIDDVVNDPAKRERVRRAFKISRDIDRDLAAEPWQTKATEMLREALRRRIGVDGAGAMPVDNRASDGEILP